jgi:hypothetical protein
VTELPGHHSEHNYEEKFLTSVENGIQKLGSQSLYTNKKIFMEIVAILDMN